MIPDIPDIPELPKNLTELTQEECRQCNDNYWHLYLKVNEEINELLQADRIAYNNGMWTHSIRDNLEKARERLKAIREKMNILREYLAKALAKAEKDSG